MSTNNLNSDHYLAAEKTTVFNGLKALETALNPRIKSLSKKERQKYGSIKEENKLVVNKARDYKA